ncbi:conserved hypothetical protein [Ricinus communis]|uniref:Uncharacterized protein n=1 Tax=Ricinus communis TaxID=3988 RepID=B9T6U4_RICCO|nr:conserved hypothetical protein [Ricinus communis]
MEERKLNFNIPLLSVRRSSTPTRSSAPTKSSSGEKGKKNDNFHPDRRRTLPSCKPAYILDQVTEPVAVPFQWEQIPGRPKDGAVPDPQGHEEVSVTPRIPPRRVLDVVKHIDNKKPEDQDALTPQIEAKSFTNIVGRLDCSKEGVDEKAIIILENDDDEDVYSDALDTLSPTDSFSVNCSLSGVSGFDNLAVKPSGTFSIDQQAQDFMMSRFLPAAKAMTLEPPQYASRKQPVSGEQPRQTTKAVNRDRTPPVIRNRSCNIPPYHQDKEDEESEDECDDYSDSGNITAKGCGFLPRLCIKNSLCLLNPVPGMKIRTQTSMSSTKDIKKLTKAVFSRSQSPTVKKPARNAVSKQKQDSEVPSPRMVGVENKLTGGSNRFTYATDRQMISRTSPFRRSGCISPHRNEAPQSPFRGRGSQGIPKQLENLKSNQFNSFNRGYSKSQELVSYNGIRRGSRPASPTVEKTLYVDTVNAAGILCSNSEMTEDLSKESMALVCISAATEGNVNIESDQISKRDDTGSEKTSLVLVQPPIPPLLPKTPSESWLWRTLPSISSQNQSSNSYRNNSFLSKRQDTKTFSATTKWENIVKSSYLHHDHVRYSEELFPHASQQSKS